MTKEKYGYLKYQIKDLRPDESTEMLWVEDGKFTISRFNPQKYRGVIGAQEELVADSLDELKEKIVQAYRDLDFSVEFIDEKIYDIDKIKNEELKTETEVNNYIKLTAGGQFNSIERIFANSNHLKNFLATHVISSRDIKIKQVNTQDITEQYLDLVKTEKNTELTPEQDKDIFEYGIVDLETNESKNESGTRTKDQLAADELALYNSTMKQLHQAEIDYSLTEDQLKASLLVVSIAYDIQQEVAIQDYKLLTDKTISETLMK